MKERRRSEQTKIPGDTKSIDLDQPHDDERVLEAGAEGWNRLLVYWAAHAHAAADPCRHPGGSCIVFEPFLSV